MFQFRFETLLRVRKIREQAALQSFATSQKHHKELKDRQQQYINSKLALDARVEIDLNKGISSAEFRMIKEYGTFILEAIKNLEEDIHVASQDMENKRQAYVDAKTKYKAMGRLKEIDFMKYRQQENLDEMKFIDEVAVTRHKEERW
ncbi:MAG: flagellar export protein FliJ [Thermodesulfobacteriota bacterium]|nr:flagellar export protein FliJ [Thermodesulfobacteriota bacterium]